MGCTRQVSRLLSNQCARYRYLILISIIGGSIFLLVSDHDHAAKKPIEKHFPPLEERFGMLARGSWADDVMEQKQIHGVARYTSRILVDTADENEQPPKRKGRRRRKSRFIIHKQRPQAKSSRSKSKRSRDKQKRKKKTKKQSKGRDKRIKKKIKHMRRRKHRAQRIERPDMVPGYLAVGADSEYGLEVNGTASDALPLNRGAPDVQPPECKNITYDTARLPNMSVIITFYNEIPSVILRAIHSLYAHTPYVLVHEVIFIDDGSNLHALQEPLSRYMQDMEAKVKFVRNRKHEGLVKCRKKATDMATGEVLVFVDSHVEFGPKWSQPLLEYLRFNHRALLQPTILTIDKDTMAYGTETTRLTPRRIRSAFSWELQKRWMPPLVEGSGTTPSSPYRVPTFVGTLVAVNANWFRQLGGYDFPVDIVGGDDIELGFRAWLCGSGAFTHPCSIVGHVYKQSRFSEQSHKEKLAHNLAAIAETWMGMYSRVFRGALVHDVTLSPAEQADVTRRRRVKTKLKCKSFDTILKYVVPDMPVPPPEALYFGAIRPYENALLDSCVVSNPDMTIVTTYGNCGAQYVTPWNTFYLDTEGVIHFMKNNHCLFVNHKAQTLYVAKCSLSKEIRPGKWAIDKINSNVKNRYISNNLLPIRIRYIYRKTSACLTRLTRKLKTQYTNTVLTPCQMPAPLNQTWTITYDFHNKGQYGGVKNIWKIF